MNVNDQDYLVAPVVFYQILPYRQQIIKYITNPLSGFPCKNNSKSSTNNENKIGDIISRCLRYSKKSEYLPQHMTLLSDTCL